MKVLVLMPAQYGTSPGQRFRIEQWARHLELEGFEFSFACFEDDALHRALYRPGAYGRKASLMLRLFARQTVRAGDAVRNDVVFLYREAALFGPALIERRIARQGIPIVYDFDDPIWMPYRSPMNGVFSRLKFPGKTRTLCRLARTVTVGNQLLAGYAARFAEHVEVIPSTIELDCYPIKPDVGPVPIVTMGWTGSHSTLPFLATIRGVLAAVASRARFRLLVISHTDQYRLDELPVDVTSRRWNADSEATDLHEMDIGLAPFPNSGWTPWRCHGKVLQYMAVGIPVVASSIGILSDYIQDGRNGFLASSEEEWIEKLWLLITDPELRRRLGAAGRATIEERFSSRMWASRMGDIIRSAAVA